LNATTLVIQTNGGLNLLNNLAPFDWVDNVTGPDASPLVFTNLGSIATKYGSGLYFLSQSGPYSNFVNSGTVSAPGVVVNAGYLENSGRIAATLGGINLQSSGKAVFKGGTLSAPASDIFITCNDFCPTNLALTDGRGLWLSAYHSLQPGSNNWVFHDGINLLYSPTNGDLRTVSMTDMAFPYANVQNQWDGIDYGANAARGYANNGVIGDLILDGGAFSQFTFSGTHRNTTSNALYVDRLDLTNAAAIIGTNGNALSISILPGMKIYFNKVFTNGTSMPGASLNGKYGVDGTNGGSFVFLADPAGSLFSVTPAALQVSVVVTNLPSPVPSASSGSAGNGSSPQALISWNSTAGATNYVYYKNQLADPGWQLLTNFVSGPQAGSLTITDPANVGGRFYQVRMDAAP
jgi:hypothetical protein